MKKILMILGLLALTGSTAWADRQAEGNSIYERFALWAFEGKTDSVLLGKEAAMEFFADNNQWEHYYYVANLSIQLKMLREDNPSSCLRECQKIYKFATDHYHEYGRAYVKAQIGWIYGYIGDHQEAVRQLHESIEAFRRLKVESRDVAGFYYVYAYMLELTGQYDEQQRIIDEGRKMAEKLDIAQKSPEACQLLADELLNIEALMQVHRGRLDKAQPLIERIRQRLDSGNERSRYEAFRAIAEYQLVSGDYEEAFATTKKMEQELQGLKNSGLQWGLKLLRTEILRHLGRSNEAYDTLRSMIDRRNSNAVSQLRRQLSEMDSQYQIDEMRVQEQKTHFWWAVFVGLICVVGIGIFAYFRQKAARLLARKNKQLAEALDHAQESDRMKTSFVQHISHEIRTPLNIITGFAQVISNPEYEIDEEDRNRMLADISRNTNEITNLVNELLELSESESQSHYDKPDDVDIAALCRQVLEESEADNCAHLSLSVESSLPEGFSIKSNSEALHKILSQLMSNALKYTEKGSVKIRLAMEGDLLRIEVEDTGIGIPEEHQEKVFERFYKADSFRQGIGLGLTVARRTAELLDGTLTLDSTYTDGARFILKMHNSHGDRHLKSKLA